MNPEDRNDFIQDNLDNPEGFIRSIANKYRGVLEDCKALGYDDLIQEGWIGLMRAAKRYDNSVEYSTYAHYWVTKYIESAVKDEIKTLVAEDRFEQENGQRSLEEAVTLEMALDELNPNERRVIDYWSEGMKQQEISDQGDVDMNQQSVSNYLNRALRKIDRKM